MPPDVVSSVENSHSLGGAKTRTVPSYVSPPHSGTVSGLSSHPVNPVPTQFIEDGNQINPSIVVIIIILTIIFFISGCVHVLIRYLARGPRRESRSAAAVTALEGQLQQLFHLHDSGVEQAFIDTLPVFLYKAVRGLKEGSDCAVCLCEFQAEDKLRLLPRCSHAFHIDCIDTWLLSHSTCPLCRGSLLHYFSDLPQAGPFLGFESGDESRGTDREGDDEDGRRFLNLGAESTDMDSPQVQALLKPGGFSFLVSDNNNSCIHSGENGPDGNGVWGNIKFMPIKLGKFRNITDGAGCEAGGAASGSSRDIRRSYSMGSYEYVLDPSDLRVFMAPTPYRRQTGGTKLPLTPFHRPAFSECIPEQMEIGHGQVTPYQDPFCDGRTLTAKPGGNGIALECEGATNKSELQQEGSRKAEDGSKSWFRCKRSILPTTADKLGDSSRRAFSFRMALPRGVLPDDTPKLKQISGNSRRSLSETEVFGWREACNSQVWEPGSNNCASMPDNESADNVTEANTSLAKRTIDWLVGRPKRLVHASSSSPVVDQN